MDAERSRRALRLFERLMDEAPGDRTQRLTEWCEDDAELRAEVASLLAASPPTGDADTGIAVHAPDLLAGFAAEREAVATAGLVGRTAGPFRLLREIGRGGMASVWLAERADGVYTQQVAIKLIRPGWGADEILARFRSERQILAGLNHPNIARLLDCGVTDDDKPWLALEYVDGTDLCTFCDAAKMPLAARLHLFVNVCEAVAYAHSRLIVHRDLKPSNILVDAAGNAKLLDFGIAKLLHDNTADATNTRIFTLEYAAPEQLTGEPITTAVDVYALGLVLYRLLTGRHAYVVNREQTILDQEPARPSSTTARTSGAQEALRIAADRATNPPHLRRELQGDLDAIVLKALRKEPSQRYLSAHAFVEDVQRYLEHRPVLARRGDLRYRTRRFLQRNALAVGFVAAVVLAVAAGFGTTLAQRDRALREAKTSRHIAQFLESVFDAARPDKSRGEIVTAQQLLDAGERRINEAPDTDPAIRAAVLEALSRARATMGDFERTETLLRQALVLREAGPDRLAEAETHLRLGAIITWRGKRNEALEHARRAMTLTDASTRRGEEVLAEAEYQAGLIEFHQNPDSRDAERNLLNVAAHLRKIYGTTSIPYLDAVRQVAYRLISTDRIDEAAMFLPPAWTMLAADKPASDPARLPLLGVMGLLDVELGRNDEAVALMREFFATNERVYGAAHPNTYEALVYLATALTASGAADEAVERATAAIAAYRAHLEGVLPPHEFFPFLRAGANALDEAGRSTEAATMLAELVQRQRDDKLTSAKIAASLVALARAERRAGLYDAARLHLEESSALIDTQTADVRITALVELTCLNLIAAIPILLAPTPMPRSRSPRRRNSANACTRQHVLHSHAACEKAGTAGRRTNSLPICAPRRMIPD